LVNPPQKGAANPKEPDRGRTEAQDSAGRSEVAETAGFYVNVNVSNNERPRLLRGLF